MGIAIGDQASATSAGLYRLLFEGSPQAVLIVDAASLRVVEANRAAASKYGYPLEELTGLPLSSLWPSAEEGVLRGLSARRSGESPQIELVHVRKNGAAMEVSVDFQDVPFAGRPAIALHVTHTADHSLSAVVMDSQGRLLEMIARGCRLTPILEELVRSVEGLSGGMLGSIMLVGEDGRHARCGAAPSLPEAYSRAIDGLPIGPASGSCGTAMHWNKPVIVQDIATDPLWNDFRALALAHGLRACWSTPIRSSAGKVLGAFAMYYRKLGAPDSWDRHLVDVATHLAAVAIEREQTEQALLNDITERKRAERELEGSREELRALAARLERLREEERTRISREIHDQLGQLLAVLHMNQSVLIRSVREGAADAKRIVAELESMQEIAAGVLTCVHRIATELRPEALDGLGLIAAIEWQAADFTRRTAIRCHVDLPFAPVQPDPERSTALFRIMQEALTNVARHAGATEVRIELRQDGSFLELSVVDNGRGFAKLAAPAAASLGLIGMRERAAALQGSTTVASTPGGGTRVTARVPAD
jgi:PAS domain S-box-containing protein